MSNIKSHIKILILPIAIILGLLLHSYVAKILWLVPYVIFTILVLNFSAVDLKKMKVSKLGVIIMLFQVIVSLMLYFIVNTLTSNEIIAQALLLGVLCPVAASVVVISSILGAKRTTTTSYTIYGNILVAIVAPIYFSFIGTNQSLPFLESFWLILKKIAPVIAFPFFVVLLLQLLLPKVKEGISKFKDWALILWAFALFMSLGSTIDYIFRYHKGNEKTIIWLAILSVILCGIQFGVGKLIGKKLGEKVAGGQLLGQKNIAVGIWMATVYLNPLTTVLLAFYSISQNLFNSWQMWYFEKKRKKEMVSRM